MLPHVQESEGGASACSAATPATAAAAAAGAAAPEDAAAAVALPSDSDQDDGLEDSQEGGSTSASNVREGRVETPRSADGGWGSSEEGEEPGSPSEAAPAQQRSGRWQCTACDTCCPAALHDNQLHCEQCSHGSLYQCTHTTHIQTCTRLTRLQTLQVHERRRLCLLATCLARSVPATQRPGLLCCLTLLLSAPELQLQVAACLHSAPLPLPAAVAVRSVHLCKLPAAHQHLAVKQ
jgi:hypothetical protein